MHRLAVLLAASVILAACGGDGGGGTITEPGETTTTTVPTTTTTVATTTTTLPTPTTTLPGGALERCTSPEGYSIAYPVGWSTNDGERLPTCGQFHPEPFEVPRSDERVAAVTLYVDPVSFHDVVTASPGRDVVRASTTVRGLQAVREEFQTTSESLFGPDVPVTRYVVDLSPGVDEGPGTMFLDTVGLSGFDYERNRIVLDRMVRTLRISMEGVPTSPDIAARYEGGGTPFTLVGEVSGADVCVRVDPDGGTACITLPDRDQVEATPVTDPSGASILAGVAGDAVFEVTAHLDDGEPVRTLPAEIGSSGVRAFAVPVPAGSVTSVTWTDVTGRELGAAPVDTR